MFCVLSPLIAKFNAPFLRRKLVVGRKEGGRGGNYRIKILIPNMGGFSFLPIMKQIITKK